MIKLFISEEFKEFFLDGFTTRRYAISNFGRLLSFTDKMENGTLLKGGLANGYNVFATRVKINNEWFGRTRYIFRLVAENFIPKTSDDKKFVIHRDYVRLNDHCDNLAWVTQEELTAHAKVNPKVIEGHIKTVEHNLKSKTYKLTATKVMFIKKLLMEPHRKTRLKIIAKRFGVSEMQLHRIRTGENWGHIKVD